MDQTQILLVVGAAILLVLLLAILLLRSRKQSVRLSDVAAPPPPARPRAAMPEERAPDPLAADPEIIAAFDAQPPASPIAFETNSTPLPEPVPAGDTLTSLKGLGPKAAARLSELGITRFDQIAAWSDADVTRIDAQMGAFKGRIVRDRWVEQARLLASGEREAFEARFGKLGG